MEREREREKKKIEQDTINSDHKWDGTETLGAKGCQKKRIKRKRQRTDVWDW
jgi:hypothetical protein